MSTIGKLIISKELSDTIDILHNTIGAKEWSGVLFYQLKSGNIKELKDLVFEGKYGYPMDIGSTAATTFEYSGELMNVFEVYPDAIDCCTGIYHTHHNMQAFHSGVDMKELETNSGAYNFYISLVVNFAKTPVCKIGFPVESTVVSSMLDENGKKFNYTKSTKSIEIFDLNVEYEVPVTKPWLSDRIKVLNTPKVQPITTPVYGNFDWNSSQFRNPNTLPKVQTFNSKAKQFIINLCNIGGYGTDIASSLKNLASIEDPEEIEQFVVQLDAEFETIYFTTFDETEIKSSDMLDALKELMKFDDLYVGSEIYDSIKNEIIFYL